MIPSTLTPPSFGMSLHLKNLQAGVTEEHLTPDADRELPGASCNLVVRQHLREGGVVTTHSGRTNGFHTSWLKKEHSNGGLRVQQEGDTFVITPDTLQELVYDGSLADAAAQRRSEAFIDLTDH